MSPEDFEKLHIGQQIYFRGEQRTVVALKFLANEIYCLKRQILFDRDDEQKNGNWYWYWDNICHECSLERPKVKKKIERKVFINPSDKLSGFWYSRKESCDDRIPAILTFEIEVEE